MSRFRLKAEAPPHVRAWAVLLDKKKYRSVAHRSCLCFWRVIFLCPISNELVQINLLHSRSLAALPISAPLAFRVGDVLDISARPTLLLMCAKGINDLTKPLESTWAFSALLVLTACREANTLLHNSTRQNDWTHVRHFTAVRMWILLLRKLPLYGQYGEACFFFFFFRGRPFNYWIYQ